MYASILVLTWDCGIPSPPISTRLNYLPLSLGNLRLDALWIDGSQVSTVVYDTQKPTFIAVYMCRQLLQAI